MTQIKSGDVKAELIRRIQRLNARVDLGGSNRSKMKFKCRSSELAEFLGWLKDQESKVNVPDTDGEPLGG